MAVVKIIHTDDRTGVVTEETRNVETKTNLSIKLKKRGSNPNAQPTNQVVMQEVKKEEPTITKRPFIN